MKLVDANVLLYAVNTDATHHEPSRVWLDSALSGGDTVGLPWISLLAFIRVSTNVSIFQTPLQPAEAVAQVVRWLEARAARVLHPGERHAGILARLLDDVGTAGNLVNDAHLAALAQEHRASIVSYDNDFSRFPGIRWDRPDALLGVE